jgi:hypothetical protein
VSQASRGRRYIKFLGMAVAILAVLLALGVQPTRRLAGDSALLAMVVGALISLVGASLAGWLIVATDASTPTARMQKASLAMTVRLVTAVVLGAAAVLGGSLERTPLLFWLATSYVALLPIEVKLAIEFE